MIVIGEMSMNYLFVVAHPDDEVLGAGATISKLTKEGHNVDICIMSGEANARSNRPNDDELDHNIRQSAQILGVRSIYEGEFPNIKMNTVPHLELVQFIESVIVKFTPDVVVTHHPADTNNDHLHTSLACQAAVRLFQRDPSNKPIREVWYMEVLSSTEWSLNTAMNSFSPNTFVEVKKEGVEKKLLALSQYTGVMRPFPHPRSEEAITGLAAYRGAQSGCEYAEAFECVMRRL